MLINGNGMNIYINGAGVISPQQTFDNETFLPEVIEYDGNVLTCIAPNFKDYINPFHMRRLSRMLRMGLSAATICLRNARLETPDAAEVCFKHLTGEYATASSFGVWLGAGILKTRTIPESVLAAPATSDRPLRFGQFLSATIFWAGIIPFFCLRPEPRLYQPQEPYSGHFLCWRFFGSMHILINEMRQGFFIRAQSSGAGAGRSLAGPP